VASLSIKTLRERTARLVGVVPNVVLISAASPIPSLNCNTPPTQPIPAIRQNPEGACSELSLTRWKEFLLGRMAS
jgi:hypothetical protein